MNDSGVPASLDRAVVGLFILAAWAFFTRTWWVLILLGVLALACFRAAARRRRS
jgi:hypothetical protein